MELKYALEQAWLHSPDEKRREAVVALLKQRQDEMLAGMGLALNTPQNSGLEAMFHHADELDGLLSAVAAFVHETVFPGPEAPPAAIAAVGGYGRRELAPYSDVDILFLLSSDNDPHQQEMISFIISLLWDVGMKVGQAARTPEECIVRAARDMSIRTNLLEARFVWGDKALFDDFSKRYEALRIKTDGRDFVEAKLLERSERHKRMGQSKYMLEPNVKEGRGGLRDLHLMFWLAKYLFGITDMNDLVDQGILSRGACRKFLKAHRFLATVRCHLHMLSGRAGDILTFDAQEKIAEQMGYLSRTGQSAVERFMKHYYLVCKNVGELSGLITVIITDTLNEYIRFNPIDGSSDFYLVNDRISFKDISRAGENPLLLLKAFALKQRLKLSLNPHTLQLITDHAKSVRHVRNTPEARALFFEILLSEKPESALRQMTESGVLGYFMPEFQNIVAQVQFDLYHIYTTDEHTLKTIGYLADLDADMMPQSRRVLYTAALLHDIGKGRGGEHADKGAALAEKITAELGLDNEEAETVVWLIRRHLYMSQTAFRRDIFDPKTIEDFVGVVQSPERLRLLYALTVADIKAVGTSVWNAFKAKLLGDLFALALEKMQGADSRPRCLTEAQKKLAEKAPEKKYAFSVRTDEERNVTEFIVLAPDHDGLFAEITGAMALDDVSIIEAQIATLDNGMALDTFVIQETTMLNERKPLTNERKIKRLQDNIANAPLINIEQALKKKRAKAPAAMWSPPRVFTDNTASDACTLIEINGTDAVGFLHAVTRAMTLLNLKIVSAHIYTYGSRVVDVFYVTDKNNQKITDPHHTEQIKTALLDTINGSSALSN